MEALRRHTVLRNFDFWTTNFLDKNFTVNVHQVFLRGKKKVALSSLKKTTLESTQVSLAAKGFLRGYKPYQPVKNVSERLDDLCKESGIPTTDETHLENSVTRFILLTRCEEEFKHSIPNSILCTIKTIGNLREFYHTPVNATVPLDAMRSMDLPSNLHIQYEYHRFLPETDTMFNGKTAFPKSSTIVTGLKYKKKYRGHTQESPFR